MLQMMILLRIAKTAMNYALFQDPEIVLILAHVECVTRQL